MGTLFLICAVVGGTILVIQFVLTVIGLGGEARANTDFCHLCRSDRDQSVDAEMNPLMWTDSETLMQEGYCRKIRLDSL